MKNSKHGEMGQSLFEVVVAIGVIAIVIVGIVSVATSTIRNTSFTRNKALATRYTQEAIEWLRGQRDTNWVTFHTNADTPPRIYCLDTLSWTNSGVCGASETIGGDTILLRQVAFSNIVPAEITANVTVSWTDSQGTHQVTTSTVFTDWRSR